MIQPENEKRIGYGSLIVMALVVLQFIPIPRFGGLPLAPINIVFPLLFFFLLFRINDVFRLDGKILVLLSLLLFFTLLTFLMSLIRGEQRDLIAEFSNPIRIILYMLLFIVVCSDEKRLFFFMKLFIVMAAVSTVFGMLVYFVGGPFTSIRLWLTQSHLHAADRIISKGSNLTGIYGMPHVFGYLLAAVPVISMTVYLADHRKRWLIAFFLFVFGLFLNGERSALLMNLIVFFMLILSDKKRIVLKSIMFTSIFLSLLAFPYFLKMIGLDKIAYDSEGVVQQGTLVERLSESGVSDVIKRISWQFYGIKSVFQSPLTGVSGEEYIRIVHSLHPMATIFFDEYKDTPYPHNHYVNIGMSLGVSAWLILLALFYLLIKIHAQIKRNIYNNEKLSIVYRGILLGLVAIMGNSLFHNAGIFTFEFATCSILAFTLSLPQILREKNSTYYGRT